MLHDPPRFLGQAVEIAGTHEGRLGSVRGGRQQARVQGDVARVGDANLVDDGGRGDAPQSELDVVPRPFRGLCGADEALQHRRLGRHLLAQNALDDRGDVGPLGRVAARQDLLIAEDDRVADLDDPLLVDPADADVLVDLVVDLPHLGRLGDHVTVVDAVEQHVELRCLRLYRRIRIELERHQRAPFVPHVGEIGKGRLVGDPELVEHRFADDAVQDPDDAGRVVPGRLCRRHEMGGNVSLGEHLPVEGRVQRPGDVGQRDLAHLREARGQQLRRVHGRRFRFVAQGGGRVVEERGRRGHDGHRQQQSEGEKTPHREPQPHARLRLRPWNRKRVLAGTNRCDSHGAPLTVDVPSANR